VPLPEVLFHLPRFLACAYREDIAVMTTNAEVVVIDAEVVEVLDEAAARKLDGRIRVMAGSVRDQVQTLARLIDQAKAGEVHAVLGYPSWTAYIADVFTSAPLHLEREQRRELVGYLSGEGMSVRAIGQTVGADRNTVRSDLRQVGEFHPPGHSPAPPQAVTGMDGKSYPPAEPMQPHKSPLLDAYSQAIGELDKACRRLEKLHANDSFPANRKALRDLHWRRVAMEMEPLMNSIGDDLSGMNTCVDCKERMLPIRDYETLCKTCREESSAQ